MVGEMGITKIPTNLAVNGYIYNSENIRLSEKSLLSYNCKLNSSLNLAVKLSNSLELAKSLH